MHCQFLSGDGKFLLEGVGTELVQIPLINGIVDSFVRHALCALSVIFCDGKIYVGILTLYEFASSFELEYIEVSAKTGHNVDKLFTQALEKVCKNIDEKKY